MGCGLFLSLDVALVRITCMTTHITITENLYLG
nr:MAG TPA: Cas system-associated protein [Caudoviricetes sp.]